MTPHSTTRILAPLGALALLAVPAQAQRTYCATLGGQLHELDIMAQTVTPVTGTGVNLLFGIANLPSPNELLISGVTAGRFHVDLTTSTVSPLGGSPPIFALCNNEDDGKVYGASLGNLYEVDATTGAAVLVGATGLPNIWGLDYVPRLSSFVAHAPISNELYLLDPATGASTLLGPTSTTGLVAIWYDRAGDTLYGICDGNNMGCVVELDLTTGTATPLFTTGMNLVGIGGDVGGGGPPSVGTSYCTANPNSTGRTGVIAGFGSASVAANDLTLEASELPPNAFGFFLTSLTEASVANPGGSQGILCLGGSIGRYVGPGQIQNTGATGRYSLQLDLTQIPTPTGFVAAVAGETRRFQSWHRDSVGGSATSNFTNGLAVTFL